MTPRLTWQQALAWRMQRHYLAHAAPGDPVEVVRRLSGVQAQVLSSAELGIRLRCPLAPAGVVDELLASGRLVRTWAMRGTLHLLAPDVAGDQLSLIAAARPWEKPAWSRWFGLTPAVIGRMAEVAYDALADGPLTRDELIRALTSRAGLEHVETPLRESWGTAFKPLAWQGILAFGPLRDGRPTFVRPDRASASWSDPMDADAAGPRVLAAYLAAYGPATAANFHRWMGRLPKRLVDSLWRAAGDVVARVDVDGEPAFVRTEDLDELLEARPSTEVRLLAGFDQWVMGPGTDDPHVVPPERRTAVSRQSGWIAPVVLRGGVVAGTWKLDGAALTVSWFRESGASPRRAIAAEVERLGTLLDRRLRLIHLPAARAIRRPGRSPGQAPPEPAGRLPGRGAG